MKQLETDVQLQEIEIKQKSNEEKMKELLEKTNLVLDKMAERKKKTACGE